MLIPVVLALLLIPVPLGAEAVECSAMSPVDNSCNAGEIENRVGLVARPNVLGFVGHLTITATDEDDDDRVSRWECESFGQALVLSSCTSPTNLRRNHHYRITCVASGLRTAMGLPPPAGPWTCAVTDG